MANLVLTSQETKEIISISEKKGELSITVLVDGALFSVDVKRSDIVDHLIDRVQNYSDMLANFWNVSELSAKEIAEEISFEVWKDKDTLQEYVNTLSVDELEKI